MPKYSKKIDKNEVREFLSKQYPNFIIKTKEFEDLVDKVHEWEVFLAKNKPINLRKDILGYSIIVLSVVLFPLIANVALFITFAGLTICLNNWSERDDWNKLSMIACYVPGLC